MKLQLALFFTLFMVMSGILNSHSGKVEGDTAAPDGCDPQFSYDGIGGYCFTGQYKDGREYASADWCCECPKGKFNDVIVNGTRSFTRATSCKSCTIGTFQPNNGSTECKLCPKGRIAGLGETFCRKCSPGQYQDDYYKDICKDCPAGYAEWEYGSTACDACQPGYFANRGATSCSPCPMGTFGDLATQSSCKDCPVGYYAGRKGWASCPICGKGRYQPNKGQKCCLGCPSGYYQDHSGSKKCKKADEGHYAYPQDKRQVPCPKGRYSAVKGSPSWRCQGEVAAGRYSQETGLTSKTGGKKCRAGRYGREGATHSECADLCPAGYVCNAGTGEGEWQNCGGKDVHCPRGSKAPHDVPGGHYATGHVPNQRSAHICPLGHYCQASNKLKCPAGRYGDQQGLTSEKCVGMCDDGYWCPEGSISAREEECAPNGDPVYYCQGGFKYKCSEGYTVPRDGSNSIRRGCKPCPPEYTCTGGKRFSKLVWTDNICKHHRTRETMYVRGIDEETAPGFIGEKLTTQIRVPYERMYYQISSLVQNGETVDGDKCKKDVTNDSPITMLTQENDEESEDVRQQEGRLKVNNSTLRFGTCSRYTVQVTVTVVQSDQVAGTNESTYISETCSFAMVVQLANSSPVKRDNFSPLSQPVELQVFRGVPFGSPIGKPLDRMFTDPDGHEVTFTLADRGSDDEAVDDDINLDNFDWTHPFTVGGCTGQVKVSAPRDLHEVPKEQFSILIKVSDNYPSNPAEIFQEVKIDVVQSNRPPRVSEDLPVLSVIERSEPGTDVVAGTDPEAFNISAIIHPAFVVDPDGDKVFTRLASCGATENYCNAFRLTSRGNLTVKDPRHLSYSRPTEMARYVRIEYTDLVAAPVESLLELQIHQLREAPKVTSSGFDLDERISEGDMIGQLEAKDEHGETFEFLLTKAENNRGEHDDRVLVLSNGTIRAVTGSFNSIVCRDPPCGNCTEHDKWIDITVTAKIVDRADGMPGPIVSAPTKIRLSVNSVNKSPVLIPLSENLLVNENVESAAIADLSSLYCDRERHPIFFRFQSSISEDTHSFSLSTTGKLELHTGLDYETVQHVEIPVHIEDLGSPPGKRDDNFTVYIVDVPEPPMLEPAENRLKVKELTTYDDGPFGSIVITDSDDLAGTDKRYSSPASVFRFEQNSLKGRLQLGENGNVSISEKYVPDYESLFDRHTGYAILHLALTVIDIVNNVSSSGTVDISVIDVAEPPYFTPHEQTFAVHVALEPGDTIGFLDAQSDDFYDPVNVHLLDSPRNASSGAEAPFSIFLSESGRVMISPGSFLGITNAHVGSLFFFVSRAIDSQNLEVNGTHFIEVTNTPIPPRWEAPQGFAEGEPIRYTMSEHFEGWFEDFQPSCIDPNQRGVQYHLVSVRPSIFDDIFRLDQDTGRLSVDEPGLLDYEELSQSDHIGATLDVLCIDTFSTQTEFTGELKINIENVPESPRFLNLEGGKLSLSVKEDAPIGYPVVEVKVFDPDFSSRRNLSFSIVNDDAPGKVPFAISSPRFERNDHVTAVNLTISSNLNYLLAPNSYNLMMLVEDEVAKHDEFPVDIEVVFVNTPPKFDRSRFLISAVEDVSSGRPLAAVGDFPFQDRHLVPKWTLRVTWIDNSGLLEFSSNELYITKGASLNYEQSWYHEFGIRVEDAGGMTDDANVTLMVENVNDLLIESVSFLAHSTSGGSEVNLLGKDLGPIWAPAATNATITSPGGYMVLVSECSRAKGVDGLWNNEAVNCVVPAGVGSNLKWQLRVDQDSRIAPFTTYFEAPSPSAIVNWPSEAFTVGGQSFLVTGSGFGPKELPSRGRNTIANPVSLQYESNNYYRVGTLQALNCHVITDDTELECETAEGAGANLGFKVISGNLSFLWQRSSRWLQPDGVSYAGPNIDEVLAMSSVLPTTGLQDAFWLKGNNFGPSTELLSAKMKNGWIQWKLTCTRKNHTHLICNLPEGLGDDFNVEVNVAGQISPPSPESETISYDKPALDSVLDIVSRPPADLNTEGNELVFLHGENFGPGIRSYNQSGISVYYGEHLEYRAADCQITEPHVKIKCKTVPGVGKDHSWISEVGNQMSNQLFDVSNYHPPIVAGYSRISTTSLGVSDLETPGHEILRIYGRYFGPPGQEVDQVTYDAGNLVFQPLSCDVLDHNVMDCVTAPGAGAGYSWTVRIGGQSSEISATSYESPIIDHFEGVNGSRPQGLSPIGGEWIDVVGENFGPSELSRGFLDSVTFGPGGTKYNAVDCTILSHQRIRCITPPGHGQSHSWIIVLAGQRSNVSVNTTSYASPSLDSILPDHGPTGFDTTDQIMPFLKVEGTHLGANLVQDIPIKLLMDTHGHLQRYLDEAKVDCGEAHLLEIVLRLRQTHLFTWRTKLREEYGISCDPAIETWFDDMTAVTISRDKFEFILGLPRSHQQTFVPLPPGYGVNRSVLLQVGDTYSLPLTFDYDPPRIEAVSPSILSGERVNLTIYGSNFCGGRSCADMSLDCCGRLFVDDSEVPLDVPAGQYFHDQLYVVLAKSRLGVSLTGFPKGTVQIGVLDQPVKSERVEFTEPLPEISAQRGRVKLDNFVTRGGENFELKDIKGIKPQHKSTPEVVSVTIGGKSCSSLRVTNVLIDESTGSTFGNISCLTPPHMGKELPVSVKVNNTEVPRSRVTVHYRGPSLCYSYTSSTDTLLFKDDGCKDWLEQIGKDEDRPRPPVPVLVLPQESVSPNEGITTTGGIVTVKGFNFGEESFDIETYIYFPGVVAATHPLFHDHERMDFEIPPGAGGSENTIRHAIIELRINGDKYVASFTFQYQPPTIHSVSPRLLPTNTTNRDRLFIFGNNFGPPTGQKAGRVHYFPRISVELDIPGFDVPQKCHVVASNHSFIECIPPSGQGDEITVRVIVDDQRHEISALNYKKPLIYSISPTTGPTNGFSQGQPVDITIHGENFGVKGVVNFKGATYRPIVYTHSKVVFHLPVGYGENIPVSVVPSGITNTNGTGNEHKFSFDPPVVEEIYRVTNGFVIKDCEPIERCTARQNKNFCLLEYPDCFPTSGGVMIEVVGNNFGPIKYEEDGGALPVVELYLEGQAEGIAEVASSNTPHYVRFFLLPEGVGADLLARVVVREGESEGQLSGVSGSALLSYDPPRINRIMPNNPDSAGEAIEFRGSNLGTDELSDVRVKIGNESCRNAVTLEPHTTISCELPKTTPGSKRIELNVAQRLKVFPDWLELVVAECKKDCNDE